jgi:protein involved in plasmid replication-relaxation
MANLAEHRLLTPRDLEILTALDRTPLTASQLLKLSQIFAHPFGSERMVRERLQALGNAGWVQSSHYATMSCGGALKYYRLTKTGYHVLYGEAAVPPTKRYFSALSIGRQHHTRCLADFLVHTMVAAEKSGMVFTTFYRENTLRVCIGDECLYPDCSFQLLTPDRRELNFFVELDNHTERIRSQQDEESWQRKLRLYDSLQTIAPSRFRVLIVTTRSSQRLNNILSLAAQILRNPYRSLFYGASLPDFLRTPDAVQVACFRDHRGRPAAMLPLRWQLSQDVRAPTDVALSLAPC